MKSSPGPSPWNRSNSRRRTTTMPGNIARSHRPPLLVISQCAALYEKPRATIPGYSAKYVKAHEAPVGADFLQIVRLHQLRLKVVLRGDPATINFPDQKWLQATAQRLEALDRLSL